MGNKSSLMLQDEEINAIQNETGFSASQIERLYSRFTSDNGTLGREDFLRIPELAINPLGDRIVQAFFSETDSFDDRINFRQFMRILARFRPIKKNREIKLNSREDKLRFAFKMYDLDGDEKISRDELLAVLHMMVGSNISTEQLANIADRTIMEADKDENSTAADLIRIICQNHYDIHVDDDDDNEIYNVFAIWITETTLNDNDRFKLQLPLNRRHCLHEMKEKFLKLLKEKSFVQFRFGRNGYLSIKDEEKINKTKILRILYLEARDNINKNIYPLNISELLKSWEIDYRINRILLLADKHNESIESSRSSIEINKDLYKTLKKQTKTVSYHNSLRKTPNRWKMLMNVKKTCMNLQKDIEKIDSGNDDVVDRINPEMSLYMEYLDICRKSIPCYGGFFFEAQMERSIRDAFIHKNFYDKKILIGINENGLHLINNECPKIISSIPFSEFSYAILGSEKDHHQGLLLIKTKDDKVRKIFTRQASFIDKTVKQHVVEQAV
ncbi:Ca2+-binding actin-bundling protein (actinin), alpha chain (EF-Hand protein super) [Dermatophagoides pteronyssinus]|uniref:Ca2+-binding actin-bundling protein (Actinin), alpha chain (EF-Hand protein super) n=1 Tax=Dermatophagoides pteronyssinus TaxID=6956 RepID=A0ABQ8JI91_DERPT|nr:Ca2+-binding actin-bundling protein (actinin), alpha chain (EF-Hand protein super) [Dermatophagoides pteronyssinus]